MLRQYGPQRFRMTKLYGRQLPVGTIPAGTIIRIDPPRFGGLRNRPHPISFQVLAFLPREIGAARRGANGAYENGYVARGGHLALVRDLHDGRTYTRTMSSFIDDLV